MTTSPSPQPRRSLSLPARMAAAGVDSVFVAEATTLALGYGSQRLTSSRLWSDNMALRTRAEEAEAERDRLRAVLERCPPTSNPTLSAEYHLERINAWWRLDVYPALAKIKGADHD